jgi:hypothetical protein
MVTAVRSFMQHVLHNYNAEVLCWPAGTSFHGGSTVAMLLLNRSRRVSSPMSKVK